MSGIPASPEALARENDQLRAQIAEMQKRLADAQANPGRGPGQEGPHASLQRPPGGAGKEGSRDQDAADAGRGAKGAQSRSPGRQGLSPESRRSGDRDDERDERRDDQDVISNDDMEDQPDVARWGTQKIDPKLMPRLWAETWTEKDSHLYAGVQWRLLKPMFRELELPQSVFEWFGPIPNLAGPPLHLDKKALKEFTVQLQVLDDNLKKTLTRLKTVAATLSAVGQGIEEGRMVAEDLAIVMASLQAVMRELMDERASVAMAAAARHKPGQLHPKEIREQRAYSDGKAPSVIMGARLEAMEDGRQQKKAIAHAAQPIARRGFAEGLFKRSFHGKQVSWSGGGGGGKRQFPANGGGHAKIPRLDGPVADHAPKDAVPNWSPRGRGRGRGGSFRGRAEH